MFFTFYFCVTMYVKLSIINGVSYYWRRFLISIFVFFFCCSYSFYVDFVCQERGKVKHTCTFCCIICGFYTFTFYTLSFYSALCLLLRGSRIVAAFILAGLSFSGASNTCIVAFYQRLITTDSLMIYLVADLFCFRFLLCLTP